MAIRVQSILRNLFFAVLLLFAITNLASAQSISVGHAIPLWGNTQQAVQIDASYGPITTTFIHIYKSNPVDNQGLEANKSFLAIFLSPKINEQALSFVPEYLTVIPMVGLMNQPYPNENGRQLHFGISLSVNVIEHLDIYYKHISNGYFGKTNLGIDTVGIKLKI